MVARPLTPPMPEALFASPAYLAEFGTPVEIADLTRHKRIQYRFISANQLAPMTLLRDGEEVRVDMPTALVVNDTGLMIDAAIRDPRAGHRAYGLARGGAGNPRRHPVTYLATCLAHHTRLAPVLSAT